MIDIKYIIKRFGPELALLILGCRSYFKDEAKAEFRNYLSNENIDWDLFFNICNSYELVPFIYKVLFECKVHIEYKNIEKFRLTTVDIGYKNMQMLKQLMHLTDIFKKNNVEIVPFKGLLLSKDLFDNFLNRDSCDIDLLIHPENYRIVIKILKAEGYLEFKTTQNIEKKVRFACQSKLVKSSKNGFVTSIEVHWDPFLPMLNVPVGNRSLMQNLIKVNCHGTLLSGLTTENNLITIIGHHGVNDVWRTPKHILDVAAFSEKYKHDFDWNSALKRMKRYKMLKTCKVGLVLANNLFGTYIPDEIVRQKYNTDEILVKLLTYPLNDKNKLSLSNFRQRLILRDNFKDKVILTINYIIFRPYFVIRSLLQQSRLKILNDPNV